MSPPNLTGDPLGWCLHISELPIPNGDTVLGSEPPPHLLGCAVEGLGAADVEAEQDGVRVAVAEGTHVVIVGRAWGKRGGHRSAPHPRDLGKGVWQRDTAPCPAQGGGTALETPKRDRNPFLSGVGAQL